MVPPAHGAAQLGRVTEAMYDLEPELAENDYRAAFTSSAPVGGHCWCCSPSWPNRPSPRRCCRLVRDHVVVVAGVTDPDVVRWAASVPTEAGTAYRKAAAVAALEERRRVVPAAGAWGPPWSRRPRGPGPGGGRRPT